MKKEVKVKSAEEVFTSYFESYYTDGPRSLTKHNVKKAMEEYANQQLKQYQDKLVEIRDDLYNAVPTGQIDAFQLIRVISTHTDKLDELINLIKSQQKQ